MASSFHERPFEEGPSGLSQDARQWCVLASAGDGDAFGRLLRGHHRRLSGYLRRKIGVRWNGKIDAEDVLQESYIEAFKSIRDFQFSGPESFYHWMTSIIDHRFFNQVRHWSARKRSASRETRVGDRSQSYQQLLDRCFQDSKTPSRIVHALDAAGIMMGCLARLPEDYRQVVKRHHLDGDSFSEIAAEMNRSEDAVSRLAGRALEQLRQCMDRASRFL